MNPSWKPIEFSSTFSRFSIVDSALNWSSTSLKIRVPHFDASLNFLVGFEMSAAYTGCK